MALKPRNHWPQLSSERPSLKNKSVSSNAVRSFPGTHTTQLLVQLENKEQAVLSVTKENDQLSSALNSAETRLSELYADQGRAEEEMAARIEVIDKLRTQARELEKEKRDMQRRYNEQVSSTTFKALKVSNNILVDIYI